MAADLPRPLVLACAEITERAEIELDCALNPNLPFTLADHLNFAAERLRKGIEISTPLAYEMCIRDSSSAVPEPLSSQRPFQRLNG